MSSGNGVLVYAIPSVLALALKIVIFLMARHSLRQIRPWLWVFLLSLFGANLAELTGFYYTDNPAPSYYYMLGYYICALLACLSLLGLSLDVSGCPSRYFNRPIIVYGVLASVVVGMPGLVIAGVESIGYSVTRVAGPYYWVWQITAVVSLLSSLVVLAHCWRRNQDPLRRRRAFVLLIGSGPMVLMVVAVIAAMQVGFNFNAAVLVSLLITFLLMVLVYTETTERLFRFLSIIPTTKEHRSAGIISPLIFGHGPVHLKEASAVFEREVIKNAVERCGGNKTHAANMLGISRNTLLRKLKE
ncbi:hypothetical protein FKG94_09465 [Exilibacterium tricleocarpae]|uniref:DNA binding HTH domain-containing protein n=1 Tax=Exilibacterium tricleocarpae TaxID=2591008 RepID=A0A545TVX5_9GAMM|nr:helix-turn-helix domain-containing protein [Exilibacterium tricleocarpae]TQV81311.1 hypothetical protein FKG94_09465 [Exilibacterium tricleocarpae]